MALHERERMVEKAFCEMDQALLDIEEKYDLTFGELVRFFGRALQMHAKYFIRVERHGDTRTPGGLARGEPGGGST